MDIRWTTLNVMLVATSIGMDTVADRDVGPTAHTHTHIHTHTHTMRERE